MTAAPGPQQPEAELASSYSQVECMAAAGALEAAIHLVDDDEAAEILAGLADQWRRQGENTAVAPSTQPDMRCAYQRAGWDCERHGPAQTDRDTREGRLLEYNGRPTNVSEALVEVAAWLDTADQFIDEAFRVRGEVRPNPGDEVQRDLRHLAEWFASYPGAALSAAAYLRDAR